MTKGISVVLALWMAANYYLIPRADANAAFAEHEVAFRVVTAIVSLLVLLRKMRLVSVLWLLVGAQTAFLFMLHLRKQRQTAWRGLDTTPNTTTYTLEQEVVRNMTNAKFNKTYVRPSWKPMAADTHNAARATAM
jgi:hypothetical protein